MNDTTRAVEERYRNMILRLSPQERLKMACGMYESGKRLVLSRILKDEPHPDRPRLRAQFFLRMYGSDFTPSEADKILAAIPDMHSEREAVD